MRLFVTFFSADSIEYQLGQGNVSLYLERVRNNCSEYMCITSSEGRCVPYRTIVLAANWTKFQAGRAES